MSPLSTHVLDTSMGRPAAGIRVRVFDASGEIASTVTDKDGRCSSLLPETTALQAGTYRLLFEVGTYFPAGFYDVVEISFIVRDPAAHHHVPLLISPFGYTTYRGS